MAFVGQSLVDRGLLIGDLGHEDLPLLFVLLVLGIEIGAAGLGRLGLDVRLRLANVGRRFELLPQIEVVERQLRAQQRKVLHQLGEPVERGGIRLGGIAAVGLDELLDLVPGVLDFLPRSATLDLGDCSVGCFDDLLEPLVDLLVVGGDLLLGGFIVLLLGPDLGPHVLVLVERIALDLLGRDSDHPSSSGVEHRPANRPNRGNTKRRTR